MRACNWLQGLEGECDSSHLSILHREFNLNGNQALYQEDSAPAYEIEDTDFGLRLIALRKAGADQTYIRISSFVWPSHCWSSKSDSGCRALQSCEAMVERARWLVMLPRASLRGTPALRQSHGISVSFRYCFTRRSPR